MRQSTRKMEGSTKIVTCDKEQKRPTKIRFSQISSSSLLLAIFVCILSVNSVTSLENCSNNRFNESLNSTYMQFTKEKVSEEYSVLDKFKSLHCCAKGYRSIEWYKDGLPYPWDIEVSSLILYPEAANQTIYTRRARQQDAGVYKCVLRNETHTEEHSIALNIQESSIDRPLATYRPVPQFVHLGDHARFYCEAFIGNLGIPDAKSTLKWYQVFDENQEQEIKDSYQNLITRETGEIVGSYLIIPEVKKQHYGRYVCRIAMGNSAHKLDLYTWLHAEPIEFIDTKSFWAPIALAVIAFLLTILMFWLAKIFYSNYFHKRQNNCAAHHKATHMDDEEMGMRRI
ncbi:uncharacterized protein LOC134836079 [Culicoides brevitarsis]|uniref:uncharacterized protein LOC134836079 n=1 Tax=Culicoides brevitarsis TaxID=469753 RepID=UPI00307B743E